LIGRHSGPLGLSFGERGFTFEVLNTNIVMTNTLLNAVLLCKWTSCCRARASVASFQNAGFRCLQPLSLEVGCLQSVHRKADSHGLLSSVAREWEKVHKMRATHLNLTEIAPANMTSNRATGGNPSSRIANAGYMRGPRFVSSRTGPQSVLLGVRA